MSDAPGSDGGTLARIHLNDFRPGARFRVVSGPLDYTPRFEIQEGEGFLVDQYWAGFGTRVLRYANTNGRVLFFPREDATVRRNRTYAFGDVRDADQLAPGVVAVRVNPV